MLIAGLPRLARLRRAADFLALRQSSGRLGGRCFSMRYRSNIHGSARLGLAISKRVSRQAVERNRIKRLVRESFRRMRMQLPPLDVMVMARQEAVSQSGPDLLAELHELWGRLAALKPPPSAVTIER
jgi:ribonuclease P protein component